MIIQLYDIFTRYQSISIDSRRIIPGSIFFAIRGDTFDGNDFALEALKKGAKLAVVDRDFSIRDDRFFRVDNVMKTLQTLATYHREKLGVPVLAITGSNGKTTTKELITRVLRMKFNVHSTEGNLNNHIGVPLTILSLTPEHEFAVIEMGANHPGEIAALCKLAKPDYGLITNVGKAHLEGFGSFEGVVKAKCELYEYLKSRHAKIFINADNEILAKNAKGISSFSYGKSNAGCIGRVIRTHPFIELSCTLGGYNLDIQTKLIGRYNFENIMASIAVGHVFEVPPDRIKQAIESYEPSNNRSQVIKTEHNTIIMDAYNANPSSMKASIENFIESDFPDKVMILGDMAELGETSEMEHINIMDFISKPDFKRIILVGETFHKLNKNIKIISFESVDSLSEFLNGNPMRNCTILLKASRKTQLEKILNLI